MSLVMSAGEAMIETRAATQPMQYRSTHICRELLQRRTYQPQREVFPILLSMVNR